ncbi:MAG: crossover junction endodeoxyribonuclease RuvC [Spirochaetaceae bacterium]|jgi:crossover junction endodeoxyribonuclease RuvC|nr:crossover junction endodeoxyribonuclease RuvC [Spirochaetaceae bacterium]
MTRIIGIDPGLASTGWGVVERKGSRLRCAAYGCITTDKSIPHGERLLRIYSGIQEVLARYEPAAAAIEKLYFARNISSAMPVGEARGVLTLALVQAGLCVYELSPDEIKTAVTGVARADKKQVQEMTRLILGLTDLPRPDHAADALAAAICAVNKTIAR